MNLLKVAARVAARPKLDQHDRDTIKMSEAAVDQGLSDDALTSALEAWREKGDEESLNALNDAFWDLEGREGGPLWEMLWSDRRQSFVPSSSVPDDKDVDWEFQEEDERREQESWEEDSEE